MKFKDSPISELQIRLGIPVPDRILSESDKRVIQEVTKKFGPKRYNHHIFCNANHYKPIGGNSCICVKSIRQACEEK